MGPKRSKARHNSTMTILPVRDSGNPSGSSIVHRQERDENLIHCLTNYSTDMLGKPTYAPATPLTRMRLCPHYPMKCQRISTSHRLNGIAGSILTPSQHPHIPIARLRALVSLSISLCGVAAWMDPDSRLLSPAISPSSLDIYIYNMLLQQEFSTGCLELHNPPG
jgi:hypothetical protein